MLKNVSPRLSCCQQNDKLTSHGSLSTNVCIASDKIILNLSTKCRDIEVNRLNGSSREVIQTSKQRNDETILLLRPEISLGLEFSGTLGRLS